MDSSERWQRKRARKKEARAEKRADLQAQYEEARRAAGPLSGKAHLEGCLSFLRWLCPRCDYETDFVNHPTKYGVGSPDPDATAADEAKQEQNHASGSVHWQKTAARHRLEDWKKRCKRLLEQPGRPDVVLDLSFTGMGAGELRSLALQVCICYGASLKPITGQPEPDPPRMAIAGVREEALAALRRMQDFPSWPVPLLPALEEMPANLLHPRLVFLSPDADATLTHFEGNVTYVVGGIVDTGRWRKASLDHATSLRIESRRLPIGEYATAMGAQPCVHILTVDHAFLILAHLRAAYRAGVSPDWPAILRAVLPPRKLKGSCER
eukprot:TRINITY_DN15010_c0_g2_i2.p1 TRINITY_DN15010_c0_g2~~TRINITY_DN15010_c0_g2_i2.p1  ORF type:complete len:324 (-),score=23.47 TRINITY_DN15010_c0_g2_i2:567-1538(-)